MLLQKERSADGVSKMDHQKIDAERFRVFFINLIFLIYVWLFKWMPLLYDAVTEAPVPAGQFLLGLLSFTMMSLALLAMGYACIDVQSSTNSNKKFDDWLAIGANAIFLVGYRIV